MNPQKRIRALEAKAMAEPGYSLLCRWQHPKLYGQRDFLLDLLAGACSGDPDPREATQLELIRQSVDAQEPGAAAWLN